MIKSFLLLKPLCWTTLTLGILLTSCNTKEKQDAFAQDVIIPCDTTNQDWWVGSDGKMECFTVYKDDCLDSINRSYEFYCMYHGEVIFVDIASKGRVKSYNVYNPEIYRTRYLVGVDTAILNAEFFYYGEVQGIFDVHCGNCHGVKGQYSFLIDFPKDYSYADFIDYLFSNEPGMISNHHQALMNHKLSNPFDHAHIEFYTEQELRALLEYIQELDTFTVSEIVGEENGLLGSIPKSARSLD